MQKIERICNVGFYDKQGDKERESSSCDVKETKTYKSAGDFFYEGLKNAIIFGMSATDFWFSDPQIFYVYMHAYEEKSKLQDADNFSQGEYFLLAVQQGLADAFGKGHKKIFPEKPFLQMQSQKVDVDEKIQTAFARFNASRGKDIYGNKLK